MMHMLHHLCTSDLKTLVRDWGLGLVQVYLFGHLIFTLLNLTRCHLTSGWERDSQTLPTCTHEVSAGTSKIQNCWKIQMDPKN